MKHNTKKLLIALTTVTALSSGAQAQEKAAGKSETIKVVYEAFSLPITEAATILRSDIGDKDFYNKMVEGVRAQKVTQEMFLMGRTNSGQKINIQQAASHIYHSEAEPPELPNQVVGGPGYQQDAKGNISIANFPVTPATPNAFLTKMIGQSVEFEAQTDIIESYIEIVLRASDTKLIKRDSSGQGVSTIEMPRFSNQQINTHVAAMTGEPTFLGTISAPEELQPKEGEDRIWFAFVKASIITQ